MVTKNQFLVLRFLKPYSCINPVDYIEVLNAAIYKGKPHVNITEDSLEYLSEKGFILTTDHALPYHLSHKGRLYLSPAGIAAMDEYQSAHFQNTISLIIAVLALIFSGIAATPVVITFIQWLI